MRISDWSSDVCSSDLSRTSAAVPSSSPFRLMAAIPCSIPRAGSAPCGRAREYRCGLIRTRYEATYSRGGPDGQSKDDVGGYVQPGTRPGGGGGTGGGGRERTAEGGVGKGRGG